MAEWVVLELTTQGENEDPDILRASLLRTLKGAEIFIPASVSKVGDSRVVHKLIDNYVFVRRDQPDPFYFKAEGTKYVDIVLTTYEGKIRRISTVKDADIEKMRRQIHVETEQGIEVDDEVEIMSGAYKGIRGKVIEEIPENDSVQVYISLRSKQTIVTLPRSFLKFVPAEEESNVPAFAPFVTKLVRIQELARKAQGPLSLPSLDVSKLLKALSRAEEISPWANRVPVLINQIRNWRAWEENERIPEVNKDLMSLLNQLQKMRSYMESIKLTSEDPTLTNVSIPDMSKLVRKTQQVQGLANKAVPFTKLINQVRAGNVLLSEALPSMKRIVDLVNKVTLLHKAEFQGRAIKLQLSKIETSIRKAEEHARIKRNR